MSLFGIKPLTESTTLDTTAYSYVGETAELNEILFEAAKDINHIHNGLYVADIMMESQVLYEGASAEVLLEGVVKDFFDKIIEAFRKLWGKIKAWFQKVYKAIEVFFLPGKDFVKKYGSELHSKDSKGYTYKGHKWNKNAVSGLYEMKHTDKLDVPSYSDIKALISAADVKPNAEGKVTSTEVKEAQKEILKTAAAGRKVENISELKQKVLENAMGDKDKEEIKNFSVYSISEMIAFVKDHSKLVTALKKAEKANQKSIDNVIKGMENLKKRLSDADKAAYSSTISNCASVQRFILTVMNAGVECAITVAKKQNTEFVGALKGLMYYKGTKEGFSYMNESGEGSSLLESAMSLI